MTRSFSTFVVFPYAFSQTAHAIWYKYPNPFAEHVRSIDVLDQYVCPTTGMVYMERLIGVKQNIPAWVRLVRIFFSYIRHYSHGVHIPSTTIHVNMLLHPVFLTSVGRSSRSLIRFRTNPVQSTPSLCAYAHCKVRSVSHFIQCECEQLLMSSLSYSDFIQVKEHISYMPDNGRTRYIQNAHIECPGLTHVAHGVFDSAAARLEEFTLHRFRENAERGRSGFTHVLQAMFGPALAQLAHIATPSAN